MISSTSRSVILAIRSLLVVFDIARVGTRCILLFFDLIPTSIPFLFLATVCVIEKSLSYGCSPRTFSVHVYSLPLPRSSTMFSLKRSRFGFTTLASTYISRVTLVSNDQLSAPG